MNWILNVSFVHACFSNSPSPSHCHFFLSWRALTDNSKENRMSVNMRIHVLFYFTICITVSETDAVPYVDFAFQVKNELNMCNKAWCYQNHGINRKLYSNTKVSVQNVPQAPQSCAKRAQNGLRVWRGLRIVWGQKEEDEEEKESKSVFMRAPLRVSQCCWHSDLSTNKKQKQTTTKFSRQRQLTLLSTKDHGHPCHQHALSHACFLSHVQDSLSFGPGEESCMDKSLKEEQPPLALSPTSIFVTMAAQ